MRVGFCFYLSYALGMPGGEAATINVPGDYPTIQNAITNAVAGDTIIVAPGLYPERISFNNKNLVLRSSNPTNPATVAATIIDGGNGGAVVTFGGSETAACVLSGFTIRNGLSDYGGGVRGRPGTSGAIAKATIEYNVITSNTATEQGGGICAAQGTIRLNQITSNTATAGGGGGLYLLGTGGTPSLTSNTIAWNTANGGDGGGLRIWNGSIPITGNTINWNTAATGGGGVYMFEGSHTLVNNDISYNTAGGEGGGLHCYDVTPFVCHGNRIAGNVLSSASPMTWGGGAYIVDAESLTMENNIVAGNTMSPAGDGCGLVILESLGTVRNNTVARNTGGSGVYCELPYIGNEMNWQNMIIAGHDIGLHFRTTNGCRLGVDGTLWGDGAWANTVDYTSSGNGTLTTGSVNIWGDPAFVNPAADDYHITPSSPAKDAGVFPTASIDMDAQPRPMGFGPDIGADEIPAPSLLLVKTASTSLANAGTTVTYSLVLTAAGTGDNTGVTLEDVLPQQQRPVAVQTESGTPTFSDQWGSTVTVAFGVLHPGDVRHTTITAEITSAPLGELPLTMRNTANARSPEAAYSAYADITLQDCMCRLNDSPTEYDTVQKAVNAATQPTDVVKVAGTCIDTFSSSGKTQITYVSKPLTIRGGYTRTNWTSPDPVAHPTTLNARDLGRCVYVTGAVAVVLDGLRLTHGNAKVGGNNGEGGALYSNCTTVTVTNCWFSRSLATNGGGLRIDGAAGLVSGSTITTNTASAVGGGVVLGSSFAGELADNLVAGNSAGEAAGGLQSYGSPLIAANTFTFNSAAASAGGLRVNATKPVVRGNIVTSNTVGTGSYATGGGLTVYSCQLAKLENNILADNLLLRTDGLGSGIFVYDSDAELRHNTVARNTGGLGHGVRVYTWNQAGKTITFHNNIFAAQAVGVRLETQTNASFEGTLWGSGAWANGTDLENTGTGIVSFGAIDIHGDPAFADPDHCDYHITGASAAADSGAFPTLPDDMDGAARPTGFGPDIGADELAAPALLLSKTADRLSVNLGSTVTYSLPVTVAGTGGCTGIVLVDKLPMEQQVTSAMTDHGSCIYTPGWGGTVTCNLGVLGVGETASTTITVQLTAVAMATLPLPMRNVATVTANEAASTATLDLYLQDCHCRLNDSPTEYDSVQLAIDASTQQTDVVKVAGTCAGVVSRAGKEQTAYVSKSLTVQGGYTTSNWTTPDPVANPTVLHALGLGRVAWLIGDVNVTLDGLGITGGDPSAAGPTEHGGGICAKCTTATVNRCGVYGNNSPSRGGGMYADGGNVSILHCVLRDNVGPYGGGLYVNGSGGLIDDSIIAFNTAVYGGGGATLDSSSMAITRSEITSNTTTGVGPGGGVMLKYCSGLVSTNTVSWNLGDDGGGFYVINTGGSTSVPTIADNTIQGNTAQNGGGLFIDSSALTLRQNTIEGNTAPWGGGVFLYSAQASIEGNRFTRNTAPIDPGYPSSSGQGGGIYINQASPVMDGNTWSRNEALADGGGIYMTASSPRIDNSFITDNVAAGNGSGIHMKTNCRPTLWHNTFARNTGASGVYVTNSGTASAPVFYNTIVAGHTAGIVIAAQSNASFDGTLWGSGAWANGTDWQDSSSGSFTFGPVSVSGDPAFVAPDFDNYHIGELSAALGQAVAPTAGNGGNLHAVAADVDGQPRPMGTGPDIGADEIPAPLLLLAKTADTDVANLGATFDYSLTVSAAGMAASNDVNLTDTLPIEQEVLGVAVDRGSHTVTPGFGGGVVWNIGTLAVGENAHTTITVRVASSIPETLPKTMRNTAEVGGDASSAKAIADVVLQDCHCRLNNDPTEYATVQAAVDAATQPTDVVKIAGTCAGTNTRGGKSQHANVDRSLTIQGGYTTSNWTTPYPVANPTVLDALGQGRVLMLGPGIAVTVDGLTITGGRADGQGGAGALDAGGALYAGDATLTLTNCNLLGNRADTGGGVYAVNSVCTLTSNTLHANTATDHDGGGARFDYCRLAFSANTVTSNSAYFDGGGMDTAHTSGTIADNRFAHNLAAYDGGGVNAMAYSADGSVSVCRNLFEQNGASYGGGLYVLTQHPDSALDDNVIRQNTASGQNDSRGGGLYLDNCSPALRRNTFTENSAQGQSGNINSGGGGIYMYWSSPDLSGNVITSNTAVNGGGVHMNRNCSPDVSNNYFTDNRLVSTGSGSGIYMYRSCWPVMWHNTIARNTGSGGEGVYVADQGTACRPKLFNCVITSHTVGVRIANNSSAELEGTMWGSGAWANGSDMQDSSSGNISIGTLNIHGDPDFVNPTGWDYHIGAGSAAKDIGLTTSPLTADWDDQPKPMGLGWDMGADEVPGPWLTLTKTADVEAANPGGNVVYSLTATAGGMLASEDVTVTDTLPVEQRVVSATTDRGSVAWTAGYGGTVECNVGTLNVGESAHLTIVAQMTPTFGAELPALLRNEAKTSATGCAGAAAGVDVVLHDCHCRLNNDPTEYTNLQSAIDAGTYPSDVVKVAGICSGVKLRSNELQVGYVDKTLTIRGGYSISDWTNADPETNPTVLDALERGRVLYLTESTAPVVEGLHITRGIFESGAAEGGGIFVNCTTATVRGCRIFGNRAVLGGGVFLNDNTHSELHSNTIRDNQAEWGGGVMLAECWDTPAVTLSANLITSNTASFGGGLASWQSRLIVTNNVVADNRCGVEAGAMYLSDSVVACMQMTFARNSGGDGSGIYASWTDIASTNTIITSHTVGLWTDDANACAFLEGTLWGSGEWANGTDYAGPGTVSPGAVSLHGQPAFADPDSHDYHITDISDAVDAGVDSGVADDMDGDRRPYPALHDIGADEYISTSSADLSVTKTDWPDPVAAGGDLTYWITVTNHGPKAATGVTLVDTLPPTATVVAYSTTQGDCMQSTGSVICTIGTMASAQTVQVTITVRPQANGTVTNVATVSGNEPDPDAANNTATADTQVRWGMNVWHDDTFTTDVTNPVPGATTGWTPFSSYQVGQQTDYDAANSALRVTISTGTIPRINGWMTANSEWMPYSIVGTANYARGKFYVFRTGQTNMLNLNEIPNMRLRLSTRFAVNSILEIFNHLATDPAGTNAGRDIRPSEDPTSPSVYRVDFDPVDVAALGAAGEGISRGFEAYSLETQENGSVELAESVIGTYPAFLMPDSGPEVREEKVFVASATDAGDLKVFNSLTDGPFLKKFILLAPGVLGSEIALDGSTDPTYAETAAGVTFDTTLVATNRVGLAVRELTEMGANTQRIRVVPGRQYKVRWHVTASTNANRNPQLRFRGRALKFMWSQKIEIGGALAAGNLNNTIAQQALPGVGTGNPDQQTPGEHGGWYTMILHTPMSAEIRDSQPYLNTQPGPGSPSNSTRDVKLGFDVIDTLSGMASSRQEQGRFTLDRIELRTYDLIFD